MNNKFERLIFPSRINLNFKLTAEVKKHIIEMNSFFLRSGFNEIDFSEDSDHIPHITCLMGEVSSNIAFETLIDCLSEFCKSESPLDYTITSPYWQKPSRRFVFVDTEPNGYFRDFRRRMYVKLKKILSCEHYGGPENPSHITVGYAHKRNMNLASIHKKFHPLSSTASFIRVCKVGTRGTCHDVLYTCSLNENV